MPLEVWGRKGEDKELLFAPGLGSLRGEFQYKPRRVSDSGLPGRPGPLWPRHTAQGFGVRRQEGDHTN